MTRAHVRLLGPCFKTGRTGYRPIRHRPRACRGFQNHRTPAVGGHWRQSPPVERTLGTPVPRPAALESLPRSEGGPTPPESITPCPKARPPSSGASDRRRTGRGAPPAGSASPADANAPDAPLADATPSATRLRRIESDGQTLRSSPFASKRFHVLLNSLFKVLFNFPSRYLFAIGLVSVFSLRWSLPPTLGCIIKQPDSEDVAGSVGSAP